MNDLIRRLAVPIILAAVFLLVSLLALSVVDPGNRLIRDTESVAPWASGLAAIVLAVLTIRYVSATEDMARATAELAQETRRSREAAASPLVVADFEFRRWLLFMTLENIGPGLARNVRARVFPAIPSSQGSITSLPVHGDSLPVLRPGQKHPQFVGGAPTFFSADQGNPRQYDVTVTFENEAREPQDPIVYPLDLSVYEGMLMEDEKSLSDLVPHIERIKTVLERITDSSSIHVKGPGDVKREHQEIRKQWELQEAEQKQAGNQKKDRAKVS